MANCSRRSFFGQFGRTLIADVEDVFGAVRKGLAGVGADPVSEFKPQRWLRPPGALRESEFLTTCTRCTACQEVCPYQSIRRLGPEFAAAAGTPAIIPTESPCYLCEDMPCITACEPRALIPVGRAEVRMGVAVIDLAACYVSSGQPCDYCVTRCPLRSDAIVFDDAGLPKIVEGGCTGCGVCAYLCPGRAIEIAPLSQGSSGLSQRSKARQEDGRQLQHEKEAAHVGHRG